jgi:hypothetical protein
MPSLLSGIITIVGRVHINELAIRNQNGCSSLDENQQASLKDALHVPVGPITRTRSKMIKETLSGLIQEI